MFMEEQSVVNYLLRRGQLSREELVNDSVVVVNHSRRNQNYSVRRQDGVPSLFVKQLKSSDTRLAGSFLQEAALHRLILENSDFAVLKQYVPECIGYDDQVNILAFEYLKAHKPVFELQSQPTFNGVEFAALLGKSLADIHQNAGVHTRAQSTESTPFPRAKPWILSIHHMPVVADQSVTQGMVDFVDLLRNNPSALHVLEDTSASWEATSLIHNDLSWANVIYDQENSSLQLIDWELADVGDAAWDFGTLLQNYLTASILQHAAHDTSYPPSQQANQTWLAPLTLKFNEVLTLTLSYLQHRQAHDFDALTFLQKAIRFGAARTILTGYESHYQSATLLHTAQPLLDFAVALHKDADQVAHVLLHHGGHSQ